jgi:hypothetical protein
MEPNGERPEKEGLKDRLRYLGNRSEHLGYARALEGLPDRLGSRGKRAPQRAPKTTEETRSLVEKAERRNHGPTQNPTS